MWAKWRRGKSEREDEEGRRKENRTQRLSLCPDSRLELRFSSICPSKRQRGSIRADTRENTPLLRSSQVSLTHCFLAMGFPCK